MDLMTIHMLLVLSVLWSLGVCLSDRVNLIVTVPPGYALQDYLCSGLLKSNMAIELDEGEHRISPGPLCHIFNESNIKITGSSLKNTTVRCEGEGRGFAFISVRNLTNEKLTFINCGQQLHFTENVLFKDCSFQNNSNGAISLMSSANANITNCIFADNSAVGGYGGGAVCLSGSVVNVSIANCTFQNNSAAYGGAVALNGSTVDVSITNCTFKNNSGYISGGAVWLNGSTVDVSITNCTFKNNNAYISGGAVWLNGSTVDVSITVCIFQTNNAYISAGAVWLGGSKNDASITNCTFKNNTAISGGAAWLGGLMINVSITNCTFQNNDAITGGAVFLIESKGYTNITIDTNTASDGSGAVWLHESTVWLRQSIVNFSITNCIFQNNIATYYGGGALSLGYLTIYVSITNSIFIGNSAPYSGGGAVWIDKSSLYNFSITNCKFQSNSANYGGGALGLDWSTTGDVSITNSTFHSNIANHGGGGAVWSYCIVVGSTVNLNITNCIFQNNSASYSGGAVLYEATGNIAITSSTFYNNSAVYYGGAILFATSGKILIRRSQFVNNIALVGAAVYAAYIPEQYSVSLCHLFLEDVVVNDNHHIAINNYNVTTGGAIFFNGVNVSINGSTKMGSNFSSNSPQGAIQGENGFLLLHGNITFTNNTGVNGGAISLYNHVALQFHENCNVEFSRNIATRFGGAIYNEGDQTSVQIGNAWSGWIQIMITCVIDIVGDGPFSITFSGNHADQGGHAVYATPIHNCRGTPLTSNSIITPLPEDLNETQVLSFPSTVQLCGCSDPNMCIITGQYEGKVTTYPGRTVVLNVTSVDSANNISPSVVYTQIDTSGTVSTNIALGPLQSVQWIGSKCTSMEYQIYGPEMASLRLLLSNYPGYPPTVVEVQLLPCEAGFTLMSDSSTGLMKCDCSLFLTSHGVVCDASNGTVTRQGNNWIGVYNNTLPALASTCPLDYCNNDITKLSLARPGDLCNSGRTGILCGHCHGNHSVVFGSSQCQVCSDMWLITLGMFAVLGALLVVTLFFLNLTVTQGTLYGLIFYANIIQVNTSIFFSQSILEPLQVIVSFVNFDLGLPLCFYDGMDDADKAGLQFVFPAYLLILTMTVIVLCHYCLQRSTITSTSSCLYGLPIIIGERAVGVLSTLMYLSYSKLLRTAIDILTYSTVHLPSGDIKVWFYDGNVTYLRGKHMALFAVAMLTCTLFLLPYTLAITCIPIIEQYSEHNRLFNYLHKKVNQIKPMNDAHYAPYKDEWRWWLGARLWLLVVMNGLNPVYCSDQPSLLLSIQATMMILFTVMQATVQPFGQTVRKTDEYNSHTYCYNQFYNSLDLFYLLNYTVLAQSMSYILDHGSDQTRITVCVGVLVGLYVVVLMVTVLYHLIVAILKVFKMYDRARKKINGCFRMKYKFIGSNEFTNDGMCGMREPLIEA